MKLFSGNTPVLVKRVLGNDLYGQPSDFMSYSTKVCVVEFLDNAIHTQLRQETSASHGRIDEEVAKVVLLFEVKDDIRMDDIVEIFGVSLVVDGVWPRQDIMGKTDHLRVQLHRKELAT